MADLLLHDERRLASDVDGTLATAALLWAACHERVPVDTVRAALARGAAVPRVVSEAARHGILASVWRALDEAAALDALGSDRAGVEEVVRIQRMRAELLVPASVQLAVEPLTAVGCEPVVLKGPVVAARYPAPGLRLFEDLDLLLPQRDHPRAVAALTRAGWRTVRPSRRDRYDRVLVHPGAPGMPLELHHGLEAWYDRASALDAEALWRRRVPRLVSGVQAWALPVDEELVVLGAHAAKPFHCFRRLMWVADLAMVIGAAEPASDPCTGRESIDWDHVRALARAARCATAVGAALALARLAGAAVPAEVLPLPARGWRASALASLADPRWALVDDPPIHLRFALAEGTWRRLVLLAGFTHGYPAGARAAFYLRSVGFLARRWRSLERAASAPPTVPAGRPAGTGARRNGGAT